MNGRGSEGWGAGRAAVPAGDAALWCSRQGQGQRASGQDCTDRGENRDVCDEAPAQRILHISFKLASYPQGIIIENETQK